MIVLYGLVIGVLVGWLRGGSTSRLRELTFSWPAFALCGLAVQIVLFLPPVTATIGLIGRGVYVSSTIAVLVFVLLNLRVPGMPLLATGAVSNLVAIVANGGVMPVDPAAAASHGYGPDAGFTNTVVNAHPVLRPITDIIPLPVWLPATNIVSIGDLLIAAGMAWVVIAAFGSHGERTRAPA